VHKLKIKAALALGFFTYAILINSVCIIAKEKVMGSDALNESANIFSVIPEFSILALSLFAASFIGSVGYRKSLLFAFGATALACTIASFSSSFTTFVGFFIVGGICFVPVKIATYTLAALQADSERECVRSLCFLEACFTAGIFVGDLIANRFLSYINPGTSYWYVFFFGLIAFELAVFMLLFFSPVDESKARRELSPFPEDLKATFKLTITPLVLAFIASNFLYVLIEQSATNWVLAYDEYVTHLPSSVTVNEMMMAVVFFMAVGRLIACVVLIEVTWLGLLMGCLLMAASLTLAILPLAGTSHNLYSFGQISAPLASFLLPFVAFFIAPIYPVVNAVALSAMPPQQYGRICGLIMFFSAIGGIGGRSIIRQVFGIFGGQIAFSLTLLPIVALMFCLFYVSRIRTSQR